MNIERLDVVQQRPKALLHHEAKLVRDNEVYLAKHDPTKQIPHRAALLLASKGHSSVAARNALIAALKGSDRTQRMKAALKLSLLGDNRVVPFLIGAANERQIGIYDAAIYGLCELKDRRAVPVLISALKNPRTSHSLRRKVALVLGELKESRAIHALISTLTCKTRLGPIFNYQRVFEWGRMRAILDLIGNGNGKSVDVFTALHGDHDSLIRSAAASALGRIGDRSAVSHLIAALKHKSKFVRLSAARALGTIGDTSALYPLFSVMKDNSALVRKAAQEAIEEIRRKYAPTLRERILRWR